MSTILDDHYRQRLSTVLDESVPPAERLRQASALVDDVKELRDMLARKALATHPMRTVAADAGLSLGAAQRRWGHLNPRSRT